MILAGIVTFHPDLHRLEKNIESVRPQADAVLIIDNGSDHQDAVRELAERMGVLFTAEEKNNGLARALNDLFAYACRNGYEWVITLDQDSVLPENYIELGKRYFHMNEVGIITCGYVENNLNAEVHAPESSETYLLAERCITSAAIVRVSAWQKAGGYDNDLFVDYVDFDFAVKVRHAGYQILFMNDVVLNHELGHSRWVRFFFWKVRYTAHNAQREYYIARNITIFIHRYRKTENIRQDALSLIKHYVFVLLYDKEKKEKLKALIRGRRDGKKYIAEHKQ